MRMQANRIKAQAAVAAGIDQDDKRLVAHLDRDERSALFVVKGDRGKAR